MRYLHLMRHRCRFAVPIAILMLAVAPRNGTAQQELPKLAIHLVPKVSGPPAACKLSPIPRCSQSLDGEFTLSGDAGVRYLAYIVMIDVDPQRGGVKGVEFTLDYDPTIEIEGWQGCAPTQNFEAWPDSGGAIALAWPDTACQATEPDSLDILGRPALVLGALILTARLPGFLLLSDAKITWCDGTQSIPFDTNSAMASFGLGYIRAWPGGVWDPCVNNANWECSCRGGGISSCGCCYEGRWLWQSDPKLCQRTGGIYGACCYTPVIPSTWGRIKARYP